MNIFSKLVNFFRVWDTKKLVRNIKFLVSHELSEEFFMAIDDAVEQSVFEADELRASLFPIRLKVLDKYESLKLLEENPKSLARLGDGEFGIMEGRSLAFQKYDPVLAELL